MTSNNQFTISELQQKAEAGDAQAQFELAYRLSKGVDVEKNIENALIWLNKSSEQELPQAQFALGLFLLNETGNENIAENIQQWLNDTLLLVLENTNPALNPNHLPDYFKNGQTKLTGWLLNKEDSLLICLIFNLWGNSRNFRIFDDTSEPFIYNHIEASNKANNAFMWLKKAEQNGCVQAKYWLAICNRFGIGTEMSAFAYKLLMREAAEAGIARAQYELALCYFEDEGTEQNGRLAIEWCQKAAEQGVENAQYRLSQCYFDGEHIEKNDGSGFVWLKKAATQGMEVAEYRLACCYAEGIGVEKNIEEAYQWHIKAAEQDHPESQYWLARYYFNGGILNKLDDIEKHILESDPQFRNVFLDKGYERAFGWAKKSAENGYGEANLLLGFMYEYGLGIIRDRSSAFEFFKAASLDNHEGIPDFFLCDYYALGTFAPKSEELENKHREIASPEKVSAYYDIQRLLQNTDGDIHKSLLNLELDILVSCAKYDAARNLARKNSAVINEKYVAVAEQKEKLRKQLHEKEKEMLSFFTHTMRNALATAPEALRQAIQLLGSDVYEKDSNHYKAINKIASLFSSLSLTDSLIDTFKQSISDPEEFVQAWKNDHFGDATPKWVLASALRQSLNRVIFMSDTSDFRKLLKHADSTSIKAIRKSFIDEVLPLNLDAQGIDRFYQWVTEHIACLEISLSDADQIHFGTNQTRFSLLFAVSSELFLNTLRYWDGSNTIQIRWQMIGSERYELCVKNHCQPNVISRLAGTHKGLAFIKRLVELLGEEAQFSCNIEDRLFTAKLSLNESLFGEAS